ncbi:MAG: hypothetical protein H6832_03085 [Planctomycetes bacterium]|nr:hypothetical protein [Planctomycetota bacterium]
MDPRKLSSSLVLFVLVSSLSGAGSIAQTAVRVCPSMSPNPAYMTSLGGKALIFYGWNETTGGEPYIWTRAGGCQLLGDFFPGPSGSEAQQFGTAADRAFFPLTLPAKGRQLGIYDGKTVSVFDINKNGAGLPAQFTACDNLMFFTAYSSLNDIELWVAEPRGSIFRLADIYPGPFGSFPENLTCFKGRLYFNAVDPVVGRELWVSDGTAAGTRLVKDIRNPGDSRPHSLAPCTTAAGKELLFMSANTDLGYELFVFDGLDVTLVKDIRPGASASNPQHTVSCNGRVFFFADDGQNGVEPWVSDGTAAGTTLLRDINPGTAGSTGGPIVCCGDKVFFRATDGIAGVELWCSDGTGSGTVMVKDIRPGAGNSLPNWLTAVGNLLYFTADDGTYGTELWVSDGTLAGTRLVSDINPGASSSSPFSLAVCDGELFMSANHDTYGRELWKIVSPGSMVEAIGQGCGGIRLEATPASIGNTFVLTGACAPTGTINPTPPHDGYLGVTYLMLSSQPGFLFHDPALLSNRCWSWSFLLTGTLLVDAVTLTERWSRGPMSIPNVPSLKGAQLHYQTMYLDLKTILPLRTSNVVQLTIG